MNLTQEEAKSFKEAMTYLEARRVAIDQAIAALRGLMDDDELAPAPKPAARASSRKADPDTDGDEKSKTYGSEKWADKKVEALAAEGINARKRLFEGCWVVTWTEPEE